MSAIATCRPPPPRRHLRLSAIADCAPPPPGRHHCLRHRLLGTLHRPHQLISTAASLCMDGEAETQKVQKHARHQSVNKHWSWVCTRAIWPRSLPCTHCAVLGLVGQQEREGPSAQLSGFGWRGQSAHAVVQVRMGGPVWPGFNSVIYYPEGLTCPSQPGSSPL